MPDIRIILGEFLPGPFYGYIKLATNDGLDVVFNRFADKGKSAEKVAMICQGNGRHFKFYGFFNNIFDISSSLQDRILRMDMKVAESSVKV
jgi:hypothetical protein